MDGKDHNNNSDEKKGGNKEDKVEGLSQLEQDILAKSHGRGGGGPAVRPGVESRTNASNSRPGVGLTQLEQDVAAKQLARGTGVAPTAVGLSQLEQDIAAKNQSRGSSATSRPGAVAAGGGNHLTQLERDIAAKTQGQSAIGATAGGSQMERDAAAKQNARQGGEPTSPKKLTQLEHDIAAKTQARGGLSTTSTPGAVSSIGMDNLNQLEQGIIAKTQSYIPSQTVASRPGAMSSVGSSSLSRLEDNIRSKTNAMTTPVVPTSSALHQLENDVAAKQSAVGGVGVAMRPIINKPSGLSDLENEIARKMQNLDTYHSNESRLDIPSQSAAVPASQFDAGDSYNRHNAPETSTYSDTNYNFNQHDDVGYNDVPSPPLNYTQSNPSYAPGVRPDDIPIEDQEAPLYPAPGDSVDDTEIGGIEAFVAENVVDATEVAVIMSDEEEEVELKKRQRKLMIRMGLGVIGVLMAVIIPVALLTGGDDVKITPSPTLAPTNFPTLSPTSVELSNLADSLAVRGISQLTDLQDRNSAQGKALDWIVNDDTYVDTNALTDLDVKFIQRYALAVFYFSLGGDAWSSCNRNDATCSSDGSVNGWLTAADECSWFVVACADGAVNAIEFQEATQDQTFGGKLTPLKGTMPSEIGLLTSLERFVIADMDVSGPILDNIKGFKKLTLLDVHFNQFSGSIPDTFGENYPALLYMNLEENAFTGTIPKSLGSLSSAVTLNLQKNQIRGSIPSDIAAIPTLKFLNVGDNLLTGQIPVELYDPKFISLRMTNNLLAGQISTLIGEMRNLTDFTVGSSTMSGSIPTELYQVTTLKVLDLHNSSFTGSLPESGFGSLSALRVFEVYMNDFTGTIPYVAIANMVDLERLQLQDNDQLSGNITEAICDLRGTAPLTLGVLNVGCNIGCFNDCCDKNRKCGEDLFSI